MKFVCSWEVMQHLDRSLISLSTVHHTRKMLIARERSSHPPARTFTPSWPWFYASSFRVGFNILTRIKPRIVMSEKRSQSRMDISLYTYVMCGNSSDLGANTPSTGRSLLVLHVSVSSFFSRFLSYLRRPSVRWFFVFSTSSLCAADRILRERFDRFAKSSEIGQDVLCPKSRPKVILVVD